MKISYFLAKYAILAAILNFRTLAVSNVIGGQIFWQIRVLRQIWPWKQPVLFQICKKSSDMPNPSFSHRNIFQKWRQHFVKNGQPFFSKSLKFCIVRIIQFCSNFTSMWSKYLSNNVWRDFRLLMSASATVT